jgi:preprotein translocase subunit SecG
VPFLVIALLTLFPHLLRGLLNIIGEVYDKDAFFIVFRFLPVILLVFSSVVFFFVGWNAQKKYSLSVKEFLVTTLIVACSVAILDLLIRLFWLLNEQVGITAAIDGGYTTLYFVHIIGGFVTKLLFILLMAFLGSVLGYVLASEKNKTTDELSITSQKQQVTHYVYGILSSIVVTGIVFLLYYYQGAIMWIVVLLFFIVAIVLFATKRFRYVGFGMLFGVWLGLYSLINSLMGYIINPPSW